MVLSIRGSVGAMKKTSANREHLQKVAARLRDYARQLVNIVKPLENRE
jgi:hypothetical protein